MNWTNNFYSLFLQSMTQHPLLSVEGLPFEIRTISSGDQHMKGLFATQAISVGELIIAEKPLFLCRGDFSSAFNKLTDTDKELYMSYSDAYSTSEADKTINGIGRTNGLPLQDRGGAVGFFPLCSLFNHSCKPNVTHRFHPKQLTEKFFAVRDIAAGEQLTTCYADVHDTLSRRRAMIHRRFSFNCGCDFCSHLEGDAKAQAISDKNRATLLQLDNGFPNLLYNSKDAIALTDERIELMKQEGLEYLISSAYYDTFQITVAYGRLTRCAKEFVQKAHEWAVLHYGDDSDLAQKYLVYVNNPTSHKNAGLLG
ncbi:hypothetical protein P9112_009615 [Eukaryota sp. TZLM1-RC]